MSHDDMMTAAGLAREDIMHHALNNIQKRGLQDLETLGLCIAEEMGEVVQAILQYLHEDQAKTNIASEAVDLGALTIQLIVLLKTLPAVHIKAPDEEER